MRKPIAVSTSTALGDGRMADNTVVICDDGSMWSQGDMDFTFWKRLPEIPQDGNVNSEFVKAEDF